MLEFLVVEAEQKGWHLPVGLPKGTKMFDRETSEGFAEIALQCDAIEHRWIVCGGIVDRIRKGGEIVLKALAYAGPSIVEGFLSIGDQFVAQRPKVGIDLSPHAQLIFAMRTGLGLGNKPRIERLQCHTAEADHPASTRSRNNSSCNLMYNPSRPNTLGHAPLKLRLFASLSRRASSIIRPIRAPFDRLARDDQRAVGGTKKMFSARYSPQYSGAPNSSAIKPCRRARAFET
ncbi:hypothetical protein D3C71_1574910 [compost metagenome]